MQINSPCPSSQTVSKCLCKTFKQLGSVSVCVIVHLSVCNFVLSPHMWPRAECVPYWRTSEGQGQRLCACLEAVYGLFTTVLHVSVFKCGIEEFYVLPLNIKVLKGHFTLKQKKHVFLFSFL